MSARGSGAKRRQVSKPYTIPAPTGGLNGINALANMPETDAIVLDNWFPTPNWVELRNGSAQWSTGYSGWVETLLPYSGSAGEQLFGISGGSIYNATSSGAIGSAVLTGLSNSRFESVNMATAGGEFLIAANAADAPVLYSGSAWQQITGTSSPIAITGVTTTTLRSPCVWKSRLWFIQDGTLSVWYLPTSSIGGAASQFDFTALFEDGGTLQTIFKISLQDGSTFDNYIGFLTSEGELALYQGTDPAQNGMFIIVGIYKVGKPIGRRCAMKYGADTLLLTSDGVVSVTKLLAEGRTNTEDAISYKIQSLVNTDVQSYVNNWGWEMALFPLGNKLIVNVPATTESTIYQYVMNTLNNGWCTFGKMNSPWNAATFCVLGNTLYFGGNGYVAQADIGQADSGSNIIGVMKTAFTYCKYDGQKQVNMIRPTLQCAGAISPVIGINADFDDTPPITVSSLPAPAGSPWNSSSWNTSAWAQGYQINSSWQGAGAIGWALSTYVSVSTGAVQVRLQSIDYLWEPGGIL